MARSELGAVLAAAREAASSSRDQGDRFERLIAAAFEASPVMGFDKVWLWSDWPGADGPDIGVDLVGRLGESGELVAIQCKFWQGEISTEAVDSFLAASGRSEFAARMIVHTGKSIQRHGMTKIRNAHPPCGIMGLRQLGELKLDWWALAKEAHAVAPGTPRRRTSAGSIGGAWADLKSSFAGLMGSYYSSVRRRWNAWQPLLRAWLVVEAVVVSALAVAVVMAGAALLVIAAAAAVAFVIMSAAAATSTKRRRRRSLIGTAAMTALVTSYVKGRRRRSLW